MDPFGTSRRLICMTTFHTNHHGLILRREVLNLGQTDNHLRKAVADKTVTPVWPGVWLPSTDVPEKPEDLHKLRVWDAVDVDATFKGAPLSHESAGVFHNLSMLEPDLDRVHLSTGGRPVAVGRSTASSIPGSSTTSTSSNVTASR